MNRQAQLAHANTVDACLIRQKHGVCVCTVHCQINGLKWVTLVQYGMISPLSGEHESNQSPDIEESR